MREPDPVFQKLIDATMTIEAKLRGARGHWIDERSALSIKALELIQEDLGLLARQVGDAARKLDTAK